MAAHDMKSFFYAMVFFSTTDTIQTERKLRSQVKTIIIPTPREISKSCGFAIKFVDVGEEELVSIQNQVKVPHALYMIIGNNGAERQVRLIEESNGACV